ncbi:glutamate--cysteine ligase [Arthrobacter sp. ISL-85]|nr:glutamate--cysteine ligase [Arthrobacter sp. ISL-85]
MPHAGLTGHRARTFGVEEEFLLVDPGTGQTLPRAELSLNGPDGVPSPDIRPSVGDGPALTLEVKEEQLEAVGPVCSTLGELTSAILAGRSLADDAARSVGARAVALATSPLPVASTLVPSPRYLHMATRFGLTLKEQLTCGFHVHVRVESGDEGVGALNRIRVWLPVLLALSANSPFWQGADSGYASFRYQAWSRWPTSGPTELFGSERAYRAHVGSLLATGVLLDEGMVYFDARLSRTHPTVEVRIADVCMESAHAAAIAAIVRALVERGAQEWADRVPAPQVSAPELRLAAWQASQSGVEGSLLDPLTNTPCPATEAVQALLAHVRPVLAAMGDEEQVTAELARIIAFGSGARRQRQVMMDSQSLSAVVLDAVERTHGSAKPTGRKPRGKARPSALRPGQG